MKYNWDYTMKSEDELYFLVTPLLEQGEGLGVR